MPSTIFVIHLGSLHKTMIWSNLADDASRYKHRIVTQLNWMYESIYEFGSSGIDLSEKFT